MEEELFIDPAKVDTREELELAHLLARDAFGKRRNIAKQFRYEFLLWLSGKTDIKSALKWAGHPKDGIKIAFRNGKMSVSSPKKLRKKAGPLELERISLSRIRN